MIEHCIQPRSLLSPMDADFCAQFIKVLHTQGTPGFSTLMCYDKVSYVQIILRNHLNIITPHQILGDHVKVVVFSCSEYEARNYGMRVYSALHSAVGSQLFATMQVDSCSAFLRTFASGSRTRSCTSKKIARKAVAKPFYFLACSLNGATKLRLHQKIYCRGRLSRLS